jgi:hypothetical protein
MTLAGEYAKSSFFITLNQFNCATSQIAIRELTQVLNLNKICNLLLSHLLSFNESNFQNENLSEISKNQYRPLRKGITNMIRLHATGAMALPIEIRLQILASSKDVIHS